MRILFFCLLYTGTDGEAAGVATELKTMPQILSTQAIVVPAVDVVWASGVIVFVAQGIVIQSYGLKITKILIPFKICGRTGNQLNIFKVKGS